MYTWKMTKHTWRMASQGDSPLLQEPIASRTPDLSPETRFNVRVQGGTERLLFCHH